MIPEVSDFIQGSLEDTDEEIVIADGSHVTAKKNIKYESKYAKIMDILSSQQYTMYFLRQTYATIYFQPLCY